MAKQKHNTYYNENTPDSGIYYYNENGEAKKVDVGSTYSAGEGIKIEEKIISVSADYAYNSAVSSLHNTTLTSTDDSVEISSTTAADGTVNYDLKVEVHSDTEIVGENGISAEKVPDTSTWKVGVSADYALKSDIPEITSYSAGNGIDSELIANHIVAVSENYATEEYVGDEIAKLGKPLTYSGSKTVEQINALTDVKVGTVYTIAGESGTIVSGNVECKPGDEVAWASTDEWFLIGNTIPEIHDSWKYMSELHNCEPEENSIYIGDSNVSDLTATTSSVKFGNAINIGSGNSARAGGVNIGDNNEIVSGDHTIANINIGKNNKSKFGVLIGQNNKSEGYGYVIGDNNEGCAGDMILGYNNKPNSGSCSRLILGSNNSGTYTDSLVLGRDIEGADAGEGSVIIGSNYKAQVKTGSIVLAHNGGGDSSDKDSEGNRKSITAEHDSNVIGGYTTFEQDKYVNPGILAIRNGTIIGQGQQMSAINDAMVIGSQSIAQNGSKVFGNHSVAQNGSIAINESVMSYQDLDVKNAPYINDTLVLHSENIVPLYKGIKTTYGNVKGFTYKPKTDSTDLELKIFNGISGENIENTYYNLNHYFNESTDKTCATAVFNITNNRYTIVAGTWSNDGITFTENSTGTSTAYKITAWEGTPYILTNDNGTRKLVNYNNLSPSQKEQQPKYYKKYQNIRSGDIRNNNLLVTNGEYLYSLSNYTVSNPTISTDVPTSLLDDTNHVALFTNNQTVYWYDDDTIGVGANIPSAYSYEGETASNMNFRDLTLSPSALLEVTKMISNTTAENGSVAIGPRVSASDGSIGLNVMDKYVNPNSSTTPTHLIKAETKSIGIKGIGSDGLVQSAYTYSGVLKEKDASVFSRAGSVSIGLGSYRSPAGYLAINSGNYADYCSFAVGLNNTASNGSYVIGGNASALNDAMCLGFKGGLNAASGRSIVIGTHSNAIGNAYSLGENNTAFGYGFAFGLQTNASSQGYAFGLNATANEMAAAIGTNVSATHQGYAFGGNAYATMSSYALGGNCTAYNYAVAVGLGNYAQNNSYVFGNNNTALGYSILVGFNNSQYERESYYNKSNSDILNIFGHDNSVTDYTGSAISESYVLSILGNSNWLSFQSGYDANANVYGIMLGDQNYLTGSYFGGYNIMLGLSNRSRWEAISIGSRNDVIGHSISLGWNNKTTNDNAYSHAIMLGYMNSANNNTSNLNPKNIVINNYIHYTDAELTQANNAATAAKAVIDRYTNTYNVSYMTTAGRTYSNNIKLVENSIDSRSIGIEIVYPIKAGSDYSTWSAAYLSSDFYYVVNTNSSYIESWYNDNYIPYNFYSRVRYVTESMMTNIKNQLASFWTQEKLNEYNNYLQLSATYTQMVAENNTYTTSTSSVAPETNSLIVGNNNSAASYNSYIFGSYNQALTSYPQGGNDGFVYAFGLNNTVSRNYDMAIGYGSVASGGENIVIGAAPRELPNKQSKSIGYKNFNIRSLVNGVGNIGIDSYIPLNFTAYIGQTSYQYNNTNNTYKRTNINNITYYSDTAADPGRYLSINNNIITNTNIPNMTTNYVNDNIIANSNFNFSSYDFNNNFIFDFNGNITGRFNENVIFNTPTLYYKNTNDNYSMAFNLIYNASISADIKTSFSENILLPCSYIEVSSNLFTRNLVYNSKIYQYEISGLGEIRDNIVYRSNMSATYGCYDNMLFGTIANDLTGCFSFTDYADSVTSREVAKIQQSVRLYNFGDNHIFQGMESFVVGQQNSASYINNSYIYGRRNFIKSYTGTSSFPCYYNGDKMFENLLIFGDENEFSSSSGSNTRINNNRIIGNHNKIHEPNYIMNTNIIGNNNYFGYVTTGGIESTATVCELYKNYKGYYAPLTADTKYFTNAKNIYDCYVNGARNIIGSYINGAYLLGNNNLVYTKNIPAGTSDSYCDNIKIFGNFNLSRGGSNQLAIGFGNELSGHFAMAVGDTLKTSGSQLIVGKFNAPVDAAVRDGITYDFATSSVVPLEQSGVLFAVGNGTYNVTEGYTGTNLRKGYVDKNNNPVSEYSLMDEQYIERSNAMIVSADGTVSATKFATPEIPDIAGALNDLSELVTLLQNKPTNGKYIIGVDNGTLTWVPVTV